MPQTQSRTDSPLSITANVISILTFAYAVFITLFYRSKQLASANEESKLFLQRASNELEAFLAARDRVEKHRPVFPGSFSSSIKLYLDGTHNTVEQFENQFKSVKGLGGRQKSIFDGSRFLYTKEDLTATLGMMTRMRSNLDGMYHVLINKYED